MISEEEIRTWPVAYGTHALEMRKAVDQLQTQQTELMRLHRRHMAHRDNVEALLAQADEREGPLKYVVVTAQVREAMDLQPPNK